MGLRQMDKVKKGRMALNCIVRIALTREDKA